MAGDGGGASHFASRVAASAAGHGRHFSQLHRRAVGARKSQGSAAPYAWGVTLLLEGGGHVVGSRLLLACGRAVGANELALTKAGVLHDKEGIFVDKCQVLLHLNPISTRSQP